MKIGEKNDQKVLQNQVVIKEVIVKLIIMNKKILNHQGVLGFLGCVVIPHQMSLRSTLKGMVQ